MVIKGDIAPQGFTYVTYIIETSDLDINEVTTFSHFFLIYRHVFPLLLAIPLQLEDQYSIIHLL
jgi:hypothetical protein